MSRTPRLRRNQLPSALTFQWLVNNSGVSLLDRDLTINSQTVSPTFWYNGSQATTSTWTAEYGSNLSITGSGADVTANYGSPFFDGTDSLKFNTTKYFQEATNAIGNPRTDDFIIELCGYIPTPGSSVYRCPVSKYLHSAPYYGWFIQSGSPSATGINITFYYNGAGQTITSPAGITNSFLHLMWFFDRSGSGICYANTSAGSAVSLAAVTGDVNPDVPLVVGRRNGVASQNSDQWISHIAMWKGANWLDSHLQPTLVAERFYKLCGIYPQLARGTTLPTSYTCSSSHVLSKYNSDDSAWEGWTMGAGWPRVGQLLGVNETEIGFHSEQQVSNICRYSNKFDSWTKDDIGDSVDADNTNHPTSIKGSYFDGLICDNSAANHKFRTACVQNPTAVNHSLSYEIKKGAANHCYIQFLGSVLGTKRAYFNLSTYTVGYLSSGASATIEPIGNNRYIITMSITAVVEYTVCYIAPCDSSNGSSSNYSGGDGATVALWVANAQMEAGPERTSYIDVPSTSAVTRQADVLYFKGDDGNIGGVGSEEQGTIECDILLPNIDNPSAKSLLTLCDGGSADDQITLTGAADEALETRIVDATSETVNIQDASSDLFDGTKHTVKAKWKVNSVSQYVDGAADGTPDTTCTIPDDIDQLLPGCDNSGANQMNGLISNLHIKKKG
jgi:hypothetical protein